MAKTLVRQYESGSDIAVEGPIDKLAFGKLKQLGIEPSALCSDEVFVRRAYLDVIGTLPTSKEARAFLSDTNPKKRSILIDALLERDEFPDYWAMKWSDLMRVKAEFPINLWPLAAQAFHRWIRDSIRANMPYDRFVRTMLTASGSNFRTPYVNFYRAVTSKQPEAIATAVALTFMGVRADKWPKNRLAGFAALFSKVGYKSTGEWKEEIVFFDPAKKPPAGTLPQAVFPDWKPAKPAPDQDPRELFADWLITPKNPWFARNIANRVWYWLLGRGIVHEPDDIRPNNPPENEALLAHLGKELVGANWDLKHLFRIVLNSKTYQLSSLPRSKQPDAERHFAHYPVRRLEAEVIIDALDQMSGTTESYSSATPEPFTFIPEEQRSIALADGSITSPFLEMFGRPPRDTGLESERNNRPTAAQRLHLLNSSHIRRKIDRVPAMIAQTKVGNKPRDTVNELYLTVLSRFPTQDELKLIADYAKTAEGKRTAIVNTAWALVNGAEFLYRH